MYAPYGWTYSSANGIDNIKISTPNGRWTLWAVNESNVRIENNVTMFADNAIKHSPTHRGLKLRSFLTYDRPELIPMYVRKMAARMVNANDA